MRLLLGSDHDGMASQIGRIGQAGPNVVGFQVGEILQNFFRRSPKRQHLQYIDDADTHPANARASVALLRIDSDPA